MGVMALFFAYYHKIGLDLITFLDMKQKFGNDPSSRPEFAIYNSQIYTREMRENKDVCDKSRPHFAASKVALYAEQCCI